MSILESYSLFFLLGGIHNKEENTEQWISAGRNILYGCLMHLIMESVTENGLDSQLVGLSIAFLKIFVAVVERSVLLECPLFVIPKIIKTNNFFLQFRKKCN